MSRLKPTHRLRILHKESRRTIELAAGWENDDGSISIVLNPGVALSWRDSVDCVITLFKVDREERPEVPAAPSSPPSPPPPRRSSE